MKNADKPAFPVDISSVIDAADKLADKGESKDSIESQIPNGYGLNKRERFAMAAMQGLIATNATYNGEEDKGLLAKDAVQHADFLLAELEVTES